MNAPARRGMLALLAAVTVATLGCPTSGVTPTATTAIPDSADMVMFDMERGLFDNSIRRAIVEADTAYIYQNSQITELRRLRITFFDGTGAQTSILTAREGTFWMQRESLDARGDVELTGTDGKRLTTSHLIYDKPGNQIRTDSAFSYESPMDQLTGNGFRADPEFRFVSVEQPRGRQREGGILLPGQTP